MDEMSQGNKEKQDMESALMTQPKDPGFWREVWQQMRLVVRLMRDPEVPFYLKFVPFVGLLYLVFPFDFVTDFAPIIGQLDDITALIVGAKVFIELAPPAVVARHLHEIRVADGYDLARHESHRDRRDSERDHDQFHWHRRQWDEVHQARRVARLVDQPVH